MAANVDAADLATGASAASATDAVVSGAGGAGAGAAPAAATDASDSTPASRAVPSDVATLSVAELRRRLTELGLGQKAAHCIEKAELVALLAGAAPAAAAGAGPTVADDNVGAGPEASAETGATTAAADELSSLSVSHLRKRLRQAGLGHRLRECVEKSDMVALLAKHEAEAREAEAKAAAELLKRRAITGDAPTIPRESWESHRNYHSIASHFLGFHAHFRSGLRKLVSMANPDSPYRGGGGRNRAQALQRRVRDVSRQFHEFNSHLHTHHSIEDRHVFPQVARSKPERKAAMDMLHADHKRMDKLLDAVKSAISAGEKARSEEDLEAALRAMERALGALQAMMSQHLEDEEDLLVPMMLTGELRM